MTSTAQAALIAPLHVPLPPPLAGNTLTEDQWITLLAIADTIIPSIGSDSDLPSSKLQLSSSDFEAARLALHQDRTVRKESLASYIDESPSSLPAFKALLARTLNLYLREDAKKGLRALLSALK